MTDVHVVARPVIVPQSRPAEAAVGSEASRYFAAAAYHDRPFRQKVLAYLQHEWYRARAPEFGIDEQFVALHCRRAQRREVICDLLMLAAFCIVASAPIAVLLTDAEDLNDVALILTYFQSNLILGLLAAALVLFVARVANEHFIVTRKFSREGFAGVPAPAGKSTEEADEPQNLVVYGGYSPFVGSGHAVGGWSFSVNLERARDDLEADGKPAPFEADELVDYVSRRLDRLHIPSLRHYEVLFADGRHLRDHAALSSHGCAKQHIPATLIRSLDDLPASGTRSYLCVNVSDWSGEIVLSVYLRCARGDSNLFVEASYFLLTPMQPSFYKIDEQDPRLRVGTLFATFMQSVVSSPVMLVLAACRTAAAILTPLSRLSERGRIRQSIERNPRFNFGAITSIRELGMQNSYRVHFQQLDKERHVKTIDQCTIDAIVDFLDGHNIDTSDIRDRRSAILNNGVIVAGGELNAENMAVGKDSKATLSRLKPKRTASGAAAGAAS